MAITAQDIMSHPVISIHQDGTVRDLLALLREKRFSGVPVVDDAGLLTGVITLTDLLSIDPGVRSQGPVAASDFHTSPAMDGLSEASGMFEPAEAILDLPVGALMSRQAITTTEGASIGAVADLMASRRIHRVIVVRQQELVGIISVMDILSVLRDREIGPAQPQTAP
jgi:CBS domain-containing protein